MGPRILQGSNWKRLPVCISKAFWGPLQRSMQGVAVLCRLRTDLDNAVLRGKRREKRKKDSDKETQAN